VALFHSLGPAAQQRPAADFACEIIVVMPVSRKSRARRTYRRRDDGAAFRELGALALGALGLAWLLGKPFDEARTHFKTLRKVIMKQAI
jgi:hypothetical protein